MNKTPFIEASTQLYSEETLDLLQNGAGYRCEEVFGEGFTDIAAVTFHETYEMDNVDIPKTILLLYN